MRLAKRAKHDTNAAGTVSPEIRAVRACVKQSLQSVPVLDAATWRAVKDCARHGSLQFLFDELWVFLCHKSSARARYAALVMADGLFDRSVEFRKLVCFDLGGYGRNRVVPLSTGWRTEWSAQVL